VTSRMRPTEILPVYNSLRELPRTAQFFAVSRVGAISNTRKYKTPLGAAIAATWASKPNQTLASPL
jgi:hypothetical protein